MVSRFVFENARDVSTFKRRRGNCEERTEALNWIQINSTKYSATS